MTDILFIKTSSLGDVIHHMPALVDARRRLPDARFSWVVEEAYAPLARLHPAVDEVIPVATRRWRRQLRDAFFRPSFKPGPSTLSEIGAALDHLRVRKYDTVIDTQGLFRTALLAVFARGSRHGYDEKSVRERLAWRFYDVCHSVSRSLHAIERNRILTGLALGYQPEGDPEYGLEQGRLVSPATRPYAVMLHASANKNKLWPEDRWIAVGRALVQRGLSVVLPWGNEEERARSERIAEDVWDCRLPALKPLDEVAQLIFGAKLVVGVDTGLLHLAAALAVPLVAVFSGSEPGLTGPVGKGPIKIVGDKNSPPETAAVIAAIEEFMPPRASVL